jgi:predicted NBD/HSP70 family sugar kinase/biotin operon repressor
MSGKNAQHRLRSDNKMLVVDRLRERGALSRAELGRETGLSRTTISTLVAELLEAGFVTESGDGRRAPGGSSGGRPSKAVRLNASAGAAVSIDVGARHVAIAIGDMGHQVLARRWTPLEYGHSAEEGLEVVVRTVKELLSEANVGKGKIIGAAMGLPAPISKPDDLVASTTILPGWAGVAAGDELSERLGIPVVIDNDANLGALAEAVWGAGAGAGQIAYIKVASGIGSGLIEDGALFRGSTGTAGEIGHTTVVEDGPFCRCGNRGCLELYAGGLSLLETVRPSAPEVDTVEQLVDRALAGDPMCARAVNDSGRHIGVAVASLVNLMGPELVVVGGELGRAGDALLEPMRRAVGRSSVAAAAQAVRIVPAKLGADAEVLGGLLLVAREPWLFGADQLLSRIAVVPGKSPAGTGAVSS